MLSALEKINLSGSAIITANNSVDLDDITVTLSGSGEINLYEANINKAKVILSGDGIIRVKANEKLDITITGSGTVYYKGNDDIVSKSVTGEGKIIKEKEKLDMELFTNKVLYPNLYFFYSKHTTH